MSPSTQEQSPGSLQAFLIRPASGADIECQPQGRESNRKFGRWMANKSLRSSVSIGGFIEKERSRGIKRDESFETQSTMPSSISDRSNAVWGNEASSTTSSSSSNAGFGRKGLMSRRSTDKLERSGMPHAPRSSTEKLEPAGMPLKPRRSTERLQRTGMSLMPRRSSDNLEQAGMSLKPRRSTDRLDRASKSRRSSDNLERGYMSLMPRRSSDNFSYNVDRVPASVEAPKTYSVSVQAYVTSIVKTRGYSAEQYSALKTAYFNKPTELQVRSYGVKVTEAIQENNASALRELLKAGLSPNACNRQGESIVHMACHLGKQECLGVLLEFGASCQVSDSLGRTPLHSACLSTASESPNADIVEMILEQDRRLLFVEDAEGKVPLECLQKHQWLYWTKYFMTVKDKFWPDRDMVKNGVEKAPHLATLEANSRPRPDPLDALPWSMASKVAQGTLRPMEAAIMNYTYTPSKSEEDIQLEPA